MYLSTEYFDPNPGYQEWHLITGHQTCVGSHVAMLRDFLNIILADQGDIVCFCEKHGMTQCAKFTDQNLAVSRSIVLLYELPRNVGSTPCSFSRPLSSIFCLRAKNFTSLLNSAYMQMKLLVY